MTPREIVVFDIDDTLYLERDYVSSGFTALDPLVRAQFGVSGFARQAWQLFEAGHRGDIFDRTLAGFGLRPSAEDIAALVRAYRRHRPRICLLPDARRALDDLARFGVRVAFLTDGPRESQAAKVAALDIGCRAWRIIFTADYGPGFEKPHPRGFAQITASAGTARLAYVADNPNKDFTAPHRLGWTTIRIRRRGGLHADIPHGREVGTTVEDLSGLVGLVLGDRARQVAPW